MSAIVSAHRARGAFFETAGVRSFRLDEGRGEPVVLMHGVPTSSFLYRKVIDALAARGFRGISFDLPGLGLAERPADFDYTWTGLGRFATAVVDSMGLERFHLVVHDLGGPVGFELAAARPDRVASLTILNTLVDVETFTKPWVMRPFAVPGLNRAWLASMRIRPVFRQLMYAMGIHDRSAVSDAEVDAYLELLVRDDGGRAFLRMMGSFETTRAKSELYAATVTSDRYPVQVVWGRHDPALTHSRHGRAAERVTGLTAALVPGKHFMQEDQAEVVASMVADLARTA